jgi:poly-gamma-glutamate capsule biosynthesis protein CapA/YwtB (metallophosphatase superfamily)
MSDAGLPRRSHPATSLIAVAAAIALMAVLALNGCGAAQPTVSDAVTDARTSGKTSPEAVAAPNSATTPKNAAMPGTLTLAFAGDVHFENELARRLDDPDATLGRLSKPLRDADLAMVNMESALTSRGAPTRKELEDPSQRYWFRSPPAALELLGRSGVDAVSIANNHGADYGAVGLRDTLRAAAESEVAVVGVGDGRAEAFAPHRVTVRGTEVAVLAADASPRESADAIWSAGRSGMGIAAARNPQPLLRAVRGADRTDDVVVVYLHWGKELASCPTAGQRDLAAALADAGADVVVGTHAHVLQGAGTLGGTYVSYGLGGFHWYHGARPETGVLQVRVDADGEVMDDRLVPGLIPDEGGPARPLAGTAGAAAVQDWRDLRACARLAPGPGEERPAA